MSSVLNVENIKVGDYVEALTDGGFSYNVIREGETYLVTAVRNNWLEVQTPDHPSPLTMFFHEVKKLITVELDEDVYKDVQVGSLSTVEDTPIMWFGEDQYDWGVVGNKLVVMQKNFK